ncbi:phage recombination protein Bet, partial [Pseudomonas aeruginosa]|nr:phage recombination protein Bet [Pseudomonas aeruginosa]MCO1723325.1 phage recombination protein Bet [Pseudomonas aeruginosa]
MGTALTPLLTKFATRYEMGTTPEEVANTLKQTCFKGQVNDSQMVALLIVADQYKLNPFTKELYAFPDKNNGIVPVVGVDGWARIINENPQFDGMEFSMDQQGTECTCKIYRKDRSHAISATEYMAECKRNTQPWQSHPRRMLRHKAMIQCARLAFGFAGIYDQDEAERIVERDVTPAEQYEDV